MNLRTVLALFVAVAVSASAVGSAVAQVYAPPHGIPLNDVQKKRAAWQQARDEMIARLHLTNDQVKQLKAHEEQVKAKRPELLKYLKTATEEQRRAKLREVRKADIQSMKQILSNSQWMEYRKYLAEKAAAKRAGG